MTNLNIRGKDKYSKIGSVGILTCWRKKKEGLLPATLVFHPEMHYLSYNQQTPHVMKTIFIQALCPVLVSVLLFSCTSSSTSLLIGIDDYSFARTGEDGRPVTIDDPVFQRGEDVHLVLLNVGPFKKDDEGLHWIDMDMEITGPDGTVVLAANNLLGENGHLTLENNYAPTPYATFSTTTDLTPGKYKFKAVIYDKVGSGKATQTATFTLE